MNANGYTRRRVEVGRKDHPLDAQASSGKLRSGTPRLPYSGTNFLTRNFTDGENLKDGEEEEETRDVTQ